MRRTLLESDLVECVLGLGPGLSLQLPDGGVCCSVPPPQAQSTTGRILFIDAVSEIARESAQSFLKPEHQRRILKAYRAFADELGFAAVVPVENVIANDGNLSIRRYVKKAKDKLRGGGEPDLAAAWASLENHGREFWPQMDALVETLDDIVAEGVN